MRRLKILTWPVHGSYFNTLAQIDHDWYLPVKAYEEEGYGGRGGPESTLPPYVREMPAERVRDLDLDLILYQSERSYLSDGPEILSECQRALPSIYLEHNVPGANPFNTCHLVNDPTVLLVHVTYYNQLMWENSQTPTVVIEHSVSLDPGLRYTGELDRGISVVNEMRRRGRAAGYDVFQQLRQEVPLDTVGMKSDEIGGIGEFHYLKLHEQMARYRFLFSHMRYTSLPLAVIEAMTIGMPVVALATTELPSVIENSKTGYASNNLEELTRYMRRLIDDPNEAHRLGENARALAQARFGLDRFKRDWNAAFERAIELRSSNMPIT